MLLRILNLKLVNIGEVGYDLSGFVVSKLAGERLTRLVKYVLDTDEPLSHLDYREFEPNWIQFKRKNLIWNYQINSQEQMIIQLMKLY